jgi:ankyrin repeat protein
VPGLRVFNDGAFYPAVVAMEEKYGKAALARSKTLVNCLRSLIRPIQTRSFALSLITMLVFVVTTFLAGSSIFSWLAADRSDRDLIFLQSISTALMLIIVCLIMLAMSLAHLSTSLALATLYNRARQANGEMLEELTTDFDQENFSRRARSSYLLTAVLILISGWVLLGWQITHNIYLITAAEAGDNGRVRMLLAHGADVNGPSWIDVSTPLIDAADQNHFDTVKMLIDEGADVNKSSCGQTALGQASRRGNADMARFLLDRGANVNNDAGGTTALLLAGNAQVAKLLLDRGANIKFKTTYGHTALLEASFRGDFELIKLLLDRGANVNEEDNSGQTALIIAVSNQKINDRVGIIKLLLARGADINAKNRFGQSALMFAEQTGQRDLVELLKTGK